MTIKFKDILDEAKKKIKSADMKRQYYDLSTIDIEKALKKAFSYNEKILDSALMVYMPKANRATYVILTHDNAEDEYLFSKVIFTNKNNNIEVETNDESFNSFSNYKEAIKTMDRLYNKTYKDFM